MESEILRKIKDKRLIFTVTTGRSGTAYLASVFGYAKGVCGLHEPAPEFSDCLRDVQKDPQLARRFLLEQKLPAIASLPFDIYLETSHLACKGFFEPLLELGIVPDLLVHRRNPRDVALSMYRMGTIPGRSDKGFKFYLSPDDPGVLKLKGWEALEDYQICYWYCLEIERRARYYKDLFAGYGANIAETTLPGLKSFNGLLKCFNALKLQVKKPQLLTALRFYRSTGIKVNESRETKKNVDIPENLEQLENLVWSSIEREDLANYFPEMVGKT